MNPNYHEPKDPPISHTREEEILQTEIFLRRFKAWASRASPEHLASLMPKYTTPDTSSSTQKNESVE